MILRTVAVDDEPVALEIIRHLCAGIPYIQLEATFTNPFDAGRHMQEGSTDLVFLDIRMPDISGIELLEGLAKKPLAIFTTAYSEHAVRSFDLNAVDYLLKPFSAERFSQACAKALEVYQFRLQRSVPDYVFVRSGFEQVRIAFDGIMYVQGAGNYVQFVSAGKKIMARMTMAEAEAILPAYRFVRVHRSYIISRDKVTSADRNSVLIGEERIPIGNGYGFEL
ncbi:MAG: response regulator transcription factor [Chitinophagaceae bacterium]|nr:MAG: response regulator transcription factor [Chitinophagaceae bacterium]